MKLPILTDLTVAVDTEGSGLFPDDGARISAVSCAWRGQDGAIQSFATPFDQGLWGSVSDDDETIGDLPLGSKLLPSNHRKRLDKLCKSHGDALFWSPNRSPSAFSRLAVWLSHQRLVMHHKKYDCTMFRAGLRTRPDLSIDLMPRVIADTKLIQSCLDPEHPSSLKPSAVRLGLGRQLGMDDGAEAEEQEKLAPWKGPRDDPRFDLIPWEVLREYSRLDAVLTLLLFEHGTARLSDPDDPEEQLVRRLLRRQERLAVTLYGMEQRGVPFDTEWTARENAALRVLEDQAASEVPFRPTPPGARKYFFGAPKDGGLGLLPFSDKLTASKAGQVDEDVIERLIKLDTPGAAEYQRYQALRQARAKYYDAWPRLVGPDGRIRTCYRQGHVISGRLSVERWQSQAIVHDYQLPPGVQSIRKAFYDPDPDIILLECDVSQAEIRIAAVTADCKRMLSAIRKGISSHAAAAKLMFYPEVSLSEAKRDPQWPLHYNVAKRCNLGILYGGGVGAIHDTILAHTGIDFDRDQVGEWIGDWRSAFPPFVRALDRYSDLAAREGRVQLVDGSWRYFSEWEPVHKAFNQRIQGDVAVAMEYAMIDFDRQFPGALLLQIHDSLVVQVHRANAESMGQCLRAKMIRVFETLFRGVPFDAEIKPFGRYAYEDELVAAT